MIMRLLLYVLPLSAAVLLLAVFVVLWLLRQYANYPAEVPAGPDHYVTVLLSGLMLVSCVYLSEWRGKPAGEALLRVVLCAAFYGAVFTLLHYFLRAG